MSKIPSLPFDACHAKADHNGTYRTFVVGHCRIGGYVAKALISFLPLKMEKNLGRNPIKTAVFDDVGNVFSDFKIKYFVAVPAKVLSDLTRQPPYNPKNDHAHDLHNAHTLENVIESSGKSNRYTHTPYLLLKILYVWKEKNFISILNLLDDDKHLCLSDFKDIVADDTDVFDPFDKGLTDW